jgi:hypothetical protein
MKKLILVSCFLLMSFISSYGQWYSKEYIVSDINLLSKQQLEESLQTSKKDLLISGAVAGMGGVVLLIVKYFPYVESDESTFWEQLLGERAINGMGIVMGAGLIAGGVIAGIVYLGRIGTINSTINRNYPSAGSLHISPTIILNSNSQSYSPGISLTYNF